MPNLLEVCEQEPQRVPKQMLMSHYTHGVVNMNILELMLFHSTRFEEERRRGWFLVLSSLLRLQ